MSTTFAQASDVTHRWYVVSAKDQILGRLATRIARVLQGKNKPSYTPNTDCGDYVVVTDADHVQVTGRKGTDKLYRWHTGFAGHVKVRTFNEMRARNSAKVISLAVRRMLPQTALGRDMYRKLKVYTGADHPHVAQQPQPLP